MLRRKEFVQIFRIYHWPSASIFFVYKKMVANSSDKCETFWVAPFCNMALISWFSSLVCARFCLAGCGTFLCTGWVKVFCIRVQERMLVSCVNFSQFMKKCFSRPASSNFGGIFNENKPLITRWIYWWIYSTFCLYYPLFARCSGLQQNVTTRIPLLPLASGEGPDRKGWQPQLVLILLKSSSDFFPIFTVSAMYI